MKTNKFINDNYIIDVKIAGKVLFINILNKKTNEKIDSGTHLLNLINTKNLIQKFLNPYGSNDLINNIIEYLIEYSPIFKQKQI